ncbi:ankyrin repeat-containing protein NPR4-like [Cryptomeria japonica]|uniref:ankyrin repeat-containing protein NPR4-like n=1 Tax=Cryptomeria japonica TaxID=3369 RepID=UPI0027DA6AA0|nr:ankyrin repeat-containing protein NPR4-like [Cryptomeria japonica]
MGNSSIETDFFEACESGDMKQAKRLFGRRDFDPTKLDGMKTTVEGRSCLHVAVLAGDEVLLERLVKKLNQQKFTDEGDKRGDTALHLAVWKYRVDLVKVLLDLSLPNKKGESPLCIAVKFGFLDVVKELIDPDPETTTKRLLKPEAAQNLCKDKNVKLSKSLSTNASDNEGKRDKETVKSQPIVEGDTSLHIAAKNKNEPIVGLLRKVHGVNKQALNSEGKTPLDVAREVTEYHESFRIIKKLTDYKPSPKPFMYCAPEVSKEKHERAREMVNKSFEERRETELVVAALLATMAFTAVFTVPGGSYQDSDNQNRGTPIFLGYYMFKLFIIFDCISFFLSLFVCILWQMASELTTEDKMMFMTLSTLLTCFIFGFNACGFMAAVYTILEFCYSLISVAL